MAVAVVGASGFTILAARSLKSIQIDKATLFLSTNSSPSANWLVEQVLPGISESIEVAQNESVPLCGMPSPRFC
jgi:hypothetical protein